MSRELTWMTVASVLASVNVGQAIGEDGVPVDAQNVEYRPSGSLKWVLYDIQVLHMINCFLQLPSSI